MAVQGFVRALIAAHRMDAEVHRALSEQMLALGPGPYWEAQTRARALVRRLLELRAAEVTVSDLQMASWMLVNPAESAVHMALLEDAGLLDEPAFEAELVCVLCRYLEI